MSDSELKELAIKTALEYRNIDSLSTMLYDFGKLIQKTIADNTYAQLDRAIGRPLLSSNEITNLNNTNSGIVPPKPGRN